MNRLRANRGGTEQAAGADPADSQGNDHSVGVPGTSLQRGSSDRETKDFGADEAELFRPEQPEKKAPEGETENYRGFLYIRCGKCGKIKGFCAKKPLRDYSCTCGGKTRLAGLRVMTVRCGCCEKVFCYHTNMTEEQFTVSCLGCGAPVEVELHSRTGEYVTY